jgi:hypothetical protein
VTQGKPVPGLTRDLPHIQEAPDQVRGGVFSILNATLTRNRNALASHNNPILTTVVTA